MMGSVPPVRRAKNGRYVPTLCTDPNCGGALQLEEDRWSDGVMSYWWRCDGLTHDTDDGELEACPRTVEAAAGDQT